MCALVCFTLMLVAIVLPRRGSFRNLVCNKEQRITVVTILLWFIRLDKPNERGKWACLNA